MCYLYMYIYIYIYTYIYIYIIHTCIHIIHIYIHIQIISPTLSSGLYRLRNLRDMFCAVLRERIIIMIIITKTNIEITGKMGGWCMHGVYCLAEGRSLWVQIPDVSLSSTLSPGLSAKLRKKTSVEGPAQASRNYYYY